MNSLSHLSMVLWNCRSICNKWDSLDCITLVDSPDVICLSETWLRSDMDVVGLAPANYRIYRCDRADRGGGGVLIAVRNDVPSELITQNSCLGSENIWVRVKPKNSDFSTSIVCSYCPPKLDDWSTFDWVSSLKRKKFDCDQFIWCGDFNIPSAGRDIFPDDLCDITDSLCLEQVVNVNTRDENRLDLIFTDRPENVFSLDCEKSISDHNIISCDFKWDGKNSPTCESDVSMTKHFVYTSADLDCMNSDLSNAFYEFCENFDPLSGDIDCDWNEFKSDILCVRDKYVPTKIFFSRTGNRPPWTNSRPIKKLCNRLRRLIRRARCASPSHVSHYRALITRARRELRTILASDKRSFFDNLSDDLVGGGRKFWSYLSGITGKRGDFPTIISDGMTVTDDYCKAETFGEYFASVFSPPASDDSGPLLEDRHRTGDMPNISISVDGIRKMIDGLSSRKAAGPDGIDAALLKSVRDPASLYLHKIFVKSLNLGRIPADWRVATVIPVHKKGSRHDTSNYRPISLTSLPSKLLEHIIISNIMQFLASEMLLSDDQFGFRSGASCELLLVKLTDFVTASMDLGHQVDIVTIDMEKAFDRVPHLSLLHKLQAYGVSLDICDWYAEFLSGRTLRVRIGDTLSPSCPVTSGVPQGSVSGPVLFLLYINDILDFCKNTSIKLFMFADDITLVGRSSDSLDMQKCLDHCSNWCNAWGMRVHPSKCEAMRITRSLSKSPPSYCIGSLPVPVVDSVRCLGVTLDSRLDWTRHIQSICATARSRLAFFARLLKLANPRLRETVFNCIVRPQLNFAVCVWDPYLVHHLEALDAVRRAGFRMITKNHRRNYGVTAGIEGMGWEDWSRQRTRSRLALLFKILEGDTLIDPGPLAVPPDYIARTDHFRKVNSIFSRTDYRKYSFFPRTIRDWNALPTAAVSCGNIEQFKEFLNVYL